MHEGNNKEEQSKSFFNSTQKLIFTFISIGFFVYFNALFGEFVWDDQLQIVNTSLTHSLSNIPNMFTTGQAGVFYRPVFYSFLTFIYSIFGPNVFSFHVIQVLLHIANTILIFLLFRRFFANKLSFFLALLFLMHPINTEAVSYISAVSDPLFVFFGLLSFHIMTKVKLNWLQVALAGLLMLLSLLTKEAGFLLMLFIIIYRLLFARGEYLKTGVFVLIPVAFYFYFRFVIANVFFAKVAHYALIANASFDERLITIPKIVFFYIATFFAPVNLSIAQHWVVRSITLNDFYLPLVILVVFISLILLFAWQLYRYKKKSFAYFVFFLVWFFVSISLYLQIFPLDMTVAERWFYLPMIGLLGLIGLMAQNIRIKNKQMKTLVATCLIIIFCVLALRTIVRNTNWLTPYALFKHDVQITHNSFDIENNYSAELIKRNQYDEALVHAKKATELNPIYSPAWSTLGNIYLHKKEYKTAIFYYKKALDIDGGNFFAFHNMIYSHILLGEYTSAKGWSETALQSFPNQPELILFLAIAEYNLEHKVKALELAKRAYQLNPTAQSQYVYSTIQNNQPLIIE